MANIKNLEMAAAVSSKNYIHISESFFGWIQKVIYVPTGSRVKVITQEYSTAEGARLEKLLSLPLDKVEADLAAKGQPAPTAVGNYRLEACVSDDRQFCAVQLFRFSDLMYHPLDEPCFFEGEAAATIARLFA
ncbi:MAG: hypothetical protein IJ253_00290 [Bacteroidaceae bacterium]|nr:hypothetical protein [Bacteroidaceae bacterium]